MATTGAKRGGRAATKTIDETLMTEVIQAEQVEKPATTTKKAREYKADDLIPCRSIAGGFTNFKGRKTGNVYNFLDSGDITDIEYADLRAAMLSRSQYIYSPIFVIMDDELLAQDEWKNVVKVYEKLYNAENLEDVLRLPANQMRTVISSMPEGGRAALATLAKNLIESGEFDSMNSIKVLDEMLGTDMALSFT